MKPHEPKPGRRRSIREHYEPRISPHRENYDILDWASSRSQQTRFRVLADHVDLSGLSLLDIGCGLGDLRAYLIGRRIRVDYTGVDITEKMVEAARQRQPDGHFIWGDVFEQALLAPQSFDVVYCSGAFNLNLGNNLQFIPHAIRRMMELSRKCVVFNLLHHRARGSDSTYFYYDPQEILKLLAPTGWRSRMIEDYLPNDFTVICQRP